MVSDRRTAIVTDGGSGIGLAIARKLVQHSVDVTILGRRESVLAEAASSIGNGTEWVRADVGSRKDVQSAVQTVVERVGRIDILVNNAGFGRTITTATPIEEAESGWDEVQNANLKGAFLMTMAVAPHLSRPGGRIVNISSIAAHTGGSGAGSLAYAAAKAGVLGLTFATARELGGEGITVNAVAPGLIADTQFFGADGLPEERLHRAVSQIPAGRAGRVEDIASAVWYLVSPEASYVTGEVLGVNGGWLFGR